MFMFKKSTAMPSREDSLPGRIAASATYRRAPAGAVMFSERAPCSGFPLLLSGTVRIVQRYPNGREMQLYRVDADRKSVV